MNPSMELRLPNLSIRLKDQDGAEIRDIDLLEVVHFYGNIVPEVAKAVGGEVSSPGKARIEFLKQITVIFNEEYKIGLSWGQTAQLMQVLNEKMGELKKNGCFHVQELQPLTVSTPSDSTGPNS